MIASELSSLNFNSSVTAEPLFVICYLNIVIKSLCGNRSIFLNYHANVYFQSRNSVRVISIALMNSLADFATEILFIREKTDHSNVSIISNSTDESIIFVISW